MDTFDNSLLLSSKLFLPSQGAQSFSNLNVTGLQQSLVSQSHAIDASLQPSQIPKDFN